MHNCTCSSYLEANKPLSDPSWPTFCMSLSLQRWQRKECQEGQGGWARFWIFPSLEKDPSPSWALQKKLSKGQRWAPMLVSVRFRALTKINQSEKAISVFWKQHQWLIPPLPSFLTFRFLFTISSRVFAVEQFWIRHWKANGKTNLMI